ncbi:MAG: hypothetical protein IJ876_03695 [Elusimicrobiaceae bacterium]|nr:hypothetical protein [Elusimicrobiaceae bacterium]
MRTIQRLFCNTLRERKAQLLLPAVLLLPLFVLVIYLLVEVTKVSIAKVRHQFALDNAAYTQMTTVSVFLNAVGLLNGPLPYRVMRTYDEPLNAVDTLYRGNANVNVFDLFFQAGAVPTLASDYEWGKSPAPRPDSKDWGVHYIQNAEVLSKKDDQGNPRYDRSGWEKENPEAIKGPVYVMNKDIVATYYVAAKKVGLPAIKAYLNTYVQVGDTFNLQKHIYEGLIKNAGIFREGYYLNVDDCRKGQCARQSASRLARYLSIPTKRQEANDLVVYVSASDMAGGTGGAIEIPLNMKDMGADPLFLFAYVDGTGRARLRNLKRGISLKQNFPLPKNHFNINLESKYKPYVTNTVMMSCPRANNNCVWPNPLPKYNVILRP